MKFNGKWTGAIAGAVLMAAAGFSVVGLTGTVATTNDTDNVNIVNQDEREEVAASLEAVEDQLLKQSNPATETSAEETTSVTDEKKTEEDAAEGMTEVAATDGTQAEKETPAKEQETAPVSEYENKFMVTVSEYLNVRKEANADSEVVGKMYAGAGGDVLERGAEWTKISSGTVEGYVSNDYIVTGAEAEAKANETGKLKVTVLTDSLRIRKAASTDAGVCGYACEGEVYDGIGYEGEFIGIYYEGELAFLALDYVDVNLVIGKAISIEEEREQIRKEEERKAAQAAAEAEARAREEAERARREEEAARVMAQNASQYVETVQTSPYNVSEEDAYLLACLVMAEAGSEPYEGKLATANVVLNRLSSGRYGATMKDVIYAKGQFSVAASGRLAKILANGPNAGSVQAAQEALSGVNNVPNYYSFCAEYVAKYSRYNNYSIIGTQVFYN